MIAHIVGVPFEELIGGRPERRRRALGRHTRLRRPASPPPAVTAPAIETEGLVKTFGDTRAVDGVDLAVRARHGLRRPRPERRRQDDDDPHARHAAAARRRHRAGARPRRRRRGRRRARPRQPHRPARLGRRGPDRPREPRPARPAARLRAAPRAKARADELLEAFDLADAGGQAGQELLGRHAAPARHRGEHRRHAASCMFLDEPTTGLDPRSRNQVWDIVRALVAGARPCCSARSTSTRPTSSPTASR